MLEIKNILKFQKPKLNKKVMVSMFNQKIEIEFFGLIDVFKKSPNRVRNEDTALLRVLEVAQKAIKNTIKRNKIGEKPWSKVSAH